MASSGGSRRDGSAAEGGGRGATGSVSARPTSNCVGSKPPFDAQDRIQDAAARQQAVDALARDDLRAAVEGWFRIPPGDAYVYHAQASVTFAEVQDVVALGAQNNLHAWYRNPGDGSPLPPPPRPDVEAYVSIFDPSQAPASALKSFQSNAKKGSLRLAVATHLTSKRFVHPALTKALTVPKRKGGAAAAAAAAAADANPALDFWAWSCRSLEWCGPTSESWRVRMSHHVLPVFMHHFGCAIPSREAVEMLRVLCDGRTVVDAGSGNGYWSFVLRQHNIPTVAIDNGQSLWRTTWISDTVSADAAAWLRRQSPRGARDMVLLIVYPVVGPDGKGAFTRSLLDAYEGDTVAVVGTQNKNGYTGFADRTMDEYMEREGNASEKGSSGHSSSRSRSPWIRIVQIPLPSFGGKDEALFVFQRGDRAPKPDESPP